jgi:ribosome modulation factor
MPRAVVRVQHPYNEGYLAGTTIERAGPCNYRVGSIGFTQWVSGYSDAIEDRIHASAARNTAERCPGDKRNGRPGFTS